MGVWQGEGERGENVRGLVGLLEFGKHVGMVEMRRVAGQGVVRERWASPG